MSLISDKSVDLNFTKYTNAFFNSDTRYFSLSFAWYKIEYILTNIWDFYYFYDLISADITTYNYFAG